MREKINPMQKRIAAFFLAAFVLLFFLLALTGCGSKTESKTVACVDDLAGARIGVQIGTTGDIYVSDYEDQGSTVERYTKAADAVQALKQGKIDCIVIDEQPALAFTAQNSDLTILDEDFTEEEYAICISKDNTELKEDINDAIAELKTNGTLDKIINNYIGEDDQKGTYQYEADPTLDHSNGTLTVSTNPTFEPYEYMEGSDVVGIDIDLITAVADILNMDVVVDSIEFDSIIPAVQSGKSDIGIAGMTVTEDRLKSIDFTDSYTKATQVIIVSNGSTAQGLSLVEKFKLNFIKESRWKNITTGLCTTLEISFFAVIVGLVLGFLIAIGRVSCDKTGKCKILNWILKAYLTIIRGTPTMIQLLIIYYVVFASADINKVFVAVIAFGLNSSAYIAEIVRAGISSIDEGQFEAGRSLGFTYAQTMMHFILPQAFKNVLPALCNEFIVLIKETSISGYIGIMDLTKGGDYIRSRTYEAFMPLIAVAIVYLIIVMILTWLVSKLERRLNVNATR